MLLELLHKDEAEIAKVGVKAIEQAHAAGVAAYYIDASLGDGIVKEMPDGTRQLIDSNMDEDVVLQTLSPGR
jgi:hypothetical protein